MDNDLALVPALELLELFRRGKASPVEALRAVFSRIESYNNVLNAFCWLDRESALRDAKESEARWRKGRPKGRMDGIPVSVKDLALTKGWPTRRGSTAISPQGPWLEDAPSVERLREHGATIFGKTTVPEFGAKSSTYSALCGVTRNPWNVRLTPGGSSGGAAAAVASGMSTIDLSSDAGGSIRVPCAFTGLVGLKPTFGIVPDYPHSYLGSAAVIGPIGRTVRDVALTMSVITEPDHRDSYATPYTGHDFLDGIEEGISGLRVAFSPNLGFGKVEADIAECVERVVELLSSLGANVEVVPSIVEDPSETIDTLMTAGLANAFHRFGFTSAHRKQMDPALVAGVERGERVQLLEYLNAVHSREQLGATLRQFHLDYDLLVTPCVAIPPFEADVDNPPPDRFACGQRWKFLTPLFNHTKQPAAAVPCGISSDGLPIGIQVVGPLYADAVVLRAARAIETCVSFSLPDFRTRLVKPSAECSPQ